MYTITYHIAILHVHNNILHHYPTEAQHITLQTYHILIPHPRKMSHCYPTCAYHIALLFQTHGTDHIAIIHVCNTTHCYPPCAQHILLSYIHSINRNTLQGKHGGCLITVTCYNCTTYPHTRHIVQTNMTVTHKTSI